MQKCKFLIKAKLNNFFTKNQLRHFILCYSLRKLYLKVSIKTLCFLITKPLRKTRSLPLILRKRFGIMYLRTGLLVWEKNLNQLKDQILGLMITHQPISLKLGNLFLVKIQLKKIRDFKRKQVMQKRNQKAKKLLMEIAKQKILKVKIRMKTLRRSLKQTKKQLKIKFQMMIRRKTKNKMLKNQYLQITRKNKLTVQRKLMIVENLVRKLPKKVKKRHDSYTLYQNDKAILDF